MSDQPTPPAKRHPVFKDKKAIEYYYDVVLPMLGKYQHTSRQEWVELLSEQCIAESNFNEALTDVLKYIQQEGLDIEPDAQMLEKDAEKIFRLRFLRKVIHAAGLGCVEEDILREEVVKLYRSPSATPPAPRKPKT